jgi:NADH-quinone oxidoreductase subunit M
VAGDNLQLILAVVAVAGVVLGALYMLRFALTFLYGTPRAPHQPFGDLDRREKSILVLIVVAVFALGLFPDEPMGKTELAAKSYRQLVTTSRLPGGKP